MDYHEQTLWAYERSLDEVPSPYATHFVSTPVWDAHALNDQELNEAINDAILQGLEFKIETIPF